MLISSACSAPPRPLNEGERTSLADAGYYDALRSLDETQIDHEKLQAFISTPISSPVLVTDADGKAVAGATIHALVYDRLLTPLAYPYFNARYVTLGQTDRHGRMLVHLRGAAIQLRATKDGFRQLSESTSSLWYAPGLRHLNDKPLPHGRRPLQLGLIADDKAGKRQTIMTGSIVIPRGQRAWGVRFDAPNPQGVPAPEAELAIEWPKPEQDIIIRIPGGGIQSRDVLTARAPEQGYKDLISVRNSTSTPQRIHHGIVGRLPNGGYLAATITLHQEANGKTWFNVLAVVNRQAPYLK